ncbi:MAG: cupin domain-containing protein [Thermoplasmatota archaeon]
MAEIIDTMEEKLKIPQDFKKTPIFLFNGQYFGLAWMEGEYKLHRHDKDELFLVLEGHLSIEVEGEKREVGPDFAILIKAGEKHKSIATMRTLVAVFEPQDIHIEYLE